MSANAGFVLPVTPGAAPAGNQQTALHGPWAEDSGFQLRN